MSSDSHQLRPFSKCGLLFEERITEFFPLRAVRFGMKKDYFLHYVICLECVQFSVCTRGATPVLCSSNMLIRMYETCHIL